MGAAPRFAGSPWPDLPPELLALVLQRVPSHAGRVRLCAACRAWCSGARLHRHLMPPLLPWAALRDGTFVSLPDGVVHRLRVPDDVSHRVSTGRMLFLVHRDGRCSLMNPRTGDVALQPVSLDCFWSPSMAPCHRIADNVRKVVLSDKFVAVRTSSAGIPLAVTVYTRGGSGGGGAMCMRWVQPSNSLAAVDITEFQGKIYVLAALCMRRQYDLYVLDINGQQGSCVSSTKCVHGTPMEIDRRHGYGRSFRSFLVASGDQLLMVEQMLDGWGRGTDGKPPASHRIEVFEASDLQSGSHGRWSRVRTLSGSALFVSESCSESLPASAVGPREDCIYFMNGSFVTTRLRSGVYDMREGTALAFLPPPGQWPSTWLFPDDT